MNDARPLHQHTAPHPPHPPHAPAVPHAPHVSQVAHPPAHAPASPHAPHPPPQKPVVHAPSIRSAVIPPQTHIPTDKELEPISLVEDEPPATAAPVSQPPKKIIALGAEFTHRKHEWKRQPVKTGTGATRVRSFHGKYSEQGLEYLDNAINEWLDNNPDIEVKFVTSTVMTFEGKIREPALVLNVWY